MPLDLDSCITGIFVPGNIGASSGLTPVAPVVPSLFGEAPGVVEAAAAVDALSFFMGELLHETAHAVDTVSTPTIISAAVVEVATAADTQDAGAVALARAAMVPGVFINSDGTNREANAAGTMVNQ